MNRTRPSLTVGLLTLKPALSRKSIRFETNSFVLGTRAPSPALSAKRETVAALRTSGCAGDAGEGARVPSASLSPLVTDRFFGQGH